MVALILLLALNPGSLIPRHQGSATRDRVVIDRTMAVVEGQLIMLSDVHAAIQFGLIVPPAGTPDPLGLVLNRLVERTLLLAEVERFQPPEPDPAEIASRIDELRTRAGSDAAFEKALAVTGSTREQLSRYIRNDLRISTYLNQRFGTAPTVDPAERAASIATWIAELRRRADVTIQYRRQEAGGSLTGPAPAPSRSPRPADAGRRPRRRRTAVARTRTAAPGD